ncbi:hypothetical protein [Chryseobacterium daeguense]|nr:hypothetical protein [Chryseobacterium daeguense]
MSCVLDQRFCAIQKISKAITIIISVQKQKQIVKSIIYPAVD